METALQFVQTYGPLIALGGVVLLLMRRGGGMGCCGVPQQDGASCHAQPATTAAPGTEQRPATPTELRTQLAALQAEQDELARRISALATDENRELAGAGAPGKQYTSNETRR